jgi:hypothetical protein
MKTITAVLKMPGALPEVTEIVDTLAELQKHVGGFIEVGMSHSVERSRSVVWCDEEALIKRPRPQLNVWRPSDQHPLLGGLVATALDGEGANVSLTARESALWRAVLTACADEITRWHSDPQTKAHVEAIFNDVDSRDWIVIERALLNSTIYPFGRGGQAVRP